MSKGRNPKKKKWRNGQRQKGSHPYLDYSSIRTWLYYKHGHAGKKRNKYPRGGKFMTKFEGTRLGMKVAYYFDRNLNGLMLFYLRNNK